MTFSLSSQLLVNIQLLYIYINIYINLFPRRCLPKSLKKFKEFAELFNTWIAHKIYDKIYTRALYDGNYIIKPAYGEQMSSSYTLYYFLLWSWVNIYSSVLCLWLTKVVENFPIYLKHALIYGCSIIFPLLLYMMAFRYSDLHLGHIYLHIILWTIFCYTLNQ